MFKVTLVLIGAVTFVALLATTLSASSQTLRSDRSQLQRSLALLRANPSISSGVVTDGTKVLLDSAAREALTRTCDALNVKITLLPFYDSLAPSPPSSSSIDPPSNSPRQTAPVGPDSTSETTASVAPGTTFCTSSVPAQRSSISESTVLKGDRGHPDAQLVVTLVTPTEFEALDQVIRTELWVPILIGVLIALALLRLRALTRRETFGLSSLELSSLLQEQEALLRGISEGVIGCDHQGIVRFYNSEAQRILQLPATSVGRPLEHLIRGKRLRQVLLGDVAGRDLPVVVGRTVLSISRMTVEREGAPQGTVITLQDRTEWEALIRELDGMVGMTEALRAQAHEFSNKLHTIVGLIQLGQSDEAINVAINLSTRREFSTARLDRLDDHLLRALLLAKEAVASEKGIELSLDHESFLHGRLESPLDILTVVGNLIDNAIEEVQRSTLQPLAAITSTPPTLGWVEVGIRQDGQDLNVVVSDSGGGVPAELIHSIFTDGVSTKSSSRGSRRGLGLALVAQVAAKFGGSVSVTNCPGAVFHVTLPKVIQLTETTEERARDDLYGADQPTISTVFTTESLDQGATLGRS
jgi:sensor histidine kinase regulating citrate/malate metabolism